MSKRRAAAKRGANTRQVQRAIAAKLALEKYEYLDTNSSTKCATKAIATAFVLTQNGGEVWSKNGRKLVWIERTSALCEALVDGYIARHITQEMRDEARMTLKLLVEGIGKPALR